MRFWGFLRSLLDVRSDESWDRGDVGEDRDHGSCPGPRFGDPESTSSLSVGESGGDVEEAVAERLGLTGGQARGVTDAAQEPGPCGQVRGDRGEHQPGLVDRELPGWEATQAAVLGVSDSVLDPGVGPVPGLEEPSWPVLCWSETHVCAGYVEPQSPGVGLLRGRSASLTGEASKWC